MSARSQAQGRNQGPVVALTAPMPGSTYPAPVTITVAANGSVKVMEFYAGPTLIGSDTKESIRRDLEQRAGGHLFGDGRRARQPRHRDDVGGEGQLEWRNRVSRERDYRQRSDDSGPRAVHGISGSR
jgi:hypothetical protein